MQRNLVLVSALALALGADAGTARADDAGAPKQQDAGAAKTQEAGAKRSSGAGPRRSTDLGSGPILAPLAPADPNDDEPKRYPPTSTRWKLILGGVGLTGVAYGATLASSLIWPDVPGSGAMKIPIVGPWIALGKNACAPDSPDCGAILYVRGALEVMSGIVQASGLGLVGEGIFITTEADDAKPKSARPRIMPLPIVTGTTTGFGVVGTF